VSKDFTLNELEAGIVKLRKRAEEVRGLAQPFIGLEVTGVHWLRAIDG
jgi:hypothetical protein